MARMGNVTVLTKMLERCCFDAGFACFYWSRSWLYPEKNQIFDQIIQNLVKASSIEWIKKWYFYQNLLYKNSLHRLQQCYRRTEVYYGNLYWAMRMPRKHRRRLKAFFSLMREREKEREIENIQLDMRKNCFSLLPLISFLGFFVRLSPSATQKAQLEQNTELLECISVFILIILFILILFINKRSWRWIKILPLISIVIWRWELSQQVCLIIFTVDMWYRPIVVFHSISEINNFASLIIF